MRWNGRLVFLLVAFSMVISSMFTITVVKGSLNSPTSGAIAALGDAFLPGSGQSQYPKEFAKLHDAYNVIKSQYVQDVPADQLVEGAIEGMIQSLEDPYSAYMDPESAGEYNNALHSSFQGIGAEVTMKNGRVTIVSPYKDSPAEKAGLRPNDQVISVNGESLEGLSLHEAVEKIRGPKGTKVTLEVVREGTAQPLTIVVTRDEIPVETVYGERLKSGSFAFGKIQIAQFSTETAARFQEEVNRLEGEGIDGLIIDVRGNPGGYLKAVVDITKTLLPDKKPIVKIEYGKGSSKQGDTYNAEASELKPYPIVVLTDKGSASASEILAAAMRESGGYKLVGEKTFGKGTVQSTVQMEDDSLIKLTIAKWLTPNGDWINNKGIEPDVAVQQPEYFNAARLPDNKALTFDLAGPEVKNLQVILKGLGLDPGREDGYFDKRTEEAVKQFQKEHKLSVTGKVDQATVEALHEALLEKIRDPQNDLQLQRAIEVLKQQKTK
ncbi:S41 family peptidase [Brevibacillus humidisoli]|uniref:S41 family peptidase n=1 Tax=Brevibacillus humidisoli TaxID=2895522 RepID=UPI001E490FAE|nr:S41 family peptidase [Brevibacillus humidisoli]UFJ40004.1 S41 family peptidase [Brevibacillus humidisoli]